MYAEGVYNVYKNSVNDNLSCELFIQDDQVDENLVNELLEDIKKSKIVIYTAFSGDYDNLKEPEFIDENCDYVCFTDSDDIKSDIWEIHKYIPSRLDNNRIAKEFKVFPNKYFPEYKYSLWMDGSFKIRGSIREYIYKYIKSNMLCVIHPERNCIYDEMKCSTHFSRYPKIIMEEQIEFYKSQGMPKHYGLPTLGVIFRKHNDSQIINIMEQWWEEITKFTNQDQISLGYLLWKNKYKISVSSVYYWDNKYWSVDSNKNYHHKHNINSPLCSYNLMNNLKNNIQNTNILTKEELYILYNDIQILKHELDNNELNKKNKKLNKTNVNINNANLELNKANEELNKSNEELNKSNEELNKSNEELNKSNEELNKINIQLSEFNNKLLEKNKNLTKVNNELMEKNNDLIKTNTNLISINKKLNNEKNNLEKINKEIITSTSWKITKPLRITKNKLNKK